MVLPNNAEVKDLPNVAPVVLASVLSAKEYEVLSV